MIQEIKHRYKQEEIQVECLVKNKIDEVLSDVGNLGIILDTGYKGEDFFLKFQISRINFTKFENRFNNHSIEQLETKEIELNTD